MQVADGRTVEGRLVFLKSVRVGGFEEQNVEAAVLPPELGDAEPLLGGSFLRNYAIRMNQAAGTLTLTKAKAPTP
jgi:predicted aspartyl protease